MQLEQNQISRCIEAIEAKLGWGKGDQWTHQDFLNLSERILEETGEPLSYITLKRLWGKVTYNSLPNTNTLNTLARFVGYDSWRSFQQKQNKKKEPVLEQTTTKLFGQKKWKLLRNVVGIVVVACLLLIIISSAKGKPELNSEDFQFSSKKVVSQGIPNSVVFNIDARKSPYDSIEVQQSWNAKLRTKIPKERSQHTSIYYYPGFFEAKLVVGGEIMKEHSIHITSDGWYAAIQQEPVPVYFSMEEIHQDGRLEITNEQVDNKQVDLQPQTPIARIGNSRDFEGLKTDNFIFEAKVRNTYAEGSAVCQNTRVYLLCEGAAIWIPLIAKGCVSSTSLNFINHYASGKEKDLSAFGVDFKEEIKLRIMCVEGKASIYLNNQLAYSISDKIEAVNIKGIDFRFQGLGSVDDVKLGRPDGEWVFMDDFDN